jgi:hypothetical protein
MIVLVRLGEFPPVLAATAGSLLRSIDWKSGCFFMLLRLLSGEDLFINTLALTELRVKRDI